ncbi:hypothetical protein CBS101457_002047 [Exobasidium rhododendri]|nr:hypothetical protein CBS101457_002047 [Exobasidium rhododendri]
MANGLPSDDRMQSYLERRVRNAKDLALLSRTTLKNGLAEEFQLTDEQRARFDSDKRYKGLIKAWIQDAIDSLPDDSNVDEEEVSPAKPSKNTPKASKKEGKGLKDAFKSGSPNNAGKVGAKSSSQAKQKVKQSSVTREEKGSMSDFSELDDEDPKPARKKTKVEAKSSTAAGAALKKREVKDSGSNKNQSNSEAKLKRWKALVLECGTRRSWKKMFEEANCADDEQASDAQKERIAIAQIAVVGKELSKEGMTSPFTKEKAAEIKKQKELKKELEEITLAKKTERSGTRGTLSSLIDGEKEEKRSKGQKDKPIEKSPETKKFRRSLADFAAELNDD